tara:strand:+ start:361 stop:822 length:462 start_codon:yes stop_codon:yes gene_type:complete
MNIDLICVSNKQSDWVVKESQTYLKRLPKWLNVKVTLVTPVKSRMSLEMKLATEAQKIRKKICSEDYLIILDSQGFPLTNPYLVSEFKKLMIDGRAVKMIVGGADGVDSSLKAEAHSIWSLSKLIFPHTLSFIIFLEQIYRTTSILANHPYHK